MPRRSSGGRSASRPAPRVTPVRNPPQPVNHAPPPAPCQGGRPVLGGGLGSVVAEGMAFGTGSAVAHRAVDAFMGPRTVQHEFVSQASVASVAPTSGPTTADACSIHSKAFQDCINNFGSEISKCQFYLDMLNQCRRGGSDGIRA